MSSAARKPDENHCYPDCVKVLKNSVRHPLDHVFTYRNSGQRDWPRIYFFFAKCIVASLPFENLSLHDRFERYATIEVIQNIKRLESQPNKTPTAMLIPWQALLEQMFFKS
jgi:hypothetical protein